MSINFFFSGGGGDPGDERGKREKGKTRSKQIERREEVGERRKERRVKER